VRRNLRGKLIGQLFLNQMRADESKSQVVVTVGGRDVHVQAQHAANVLSTFKRVAQDVQAPVDVWNRDLWRDALAWIKMQRFPNSAGMEVLQHWPFDVLESLDTFREVIKNVEWNAYDIWIAIPAGPFGAVFLQSISFEKLLTVPITTSAAVEELLTVTTHPPAELFTQVMMRYNIHRNVIQHFAQLALKTEDVTKEWLLEAIRCHGIPTKGYDWLVQLGYLEGSK